MNLADIQQELRKQKLDGWLFFDHHLRDPLAYRILGLNPGKGPSRRWYYMIPAEGEPKGMEHRIERNQLAGNFPFGLLAVKILRFCKALESQLQHSLFISFCKGIDGVLSVLGDLIGRIIEIGMNDGCFKIQGISGAVLAQAHQAQKGRLCMESDHRHIGDMHEDLLFGFQFHHEFLHGGARSEQDGFFELFDTLFLYCEWR